MPSDAKVGLITGGASGMGLAVVEALLSQGWNISVLDFDATAGEALVQRLCTKQLLFIPGNVVSYDEQVAAFVRTWEEWGRIDFVYANAGIGERSDIYSPQEELPNGGPPKPNMLTLDVDLTAVMWTSYLSLHYFRKNASKSGKLVMTASAAALYPSPHLPVYAAAKSALLGLTRAMGAQLLRRNEPITVNAVCPGMVPTGLVPPAAINALEPDMVTVPQTVVDAINRFLEDDGLTGHVLEASGRDLISRPPCTPENDAARYMLGGSYVKGYDLVGMKRYEEEKRAFNERLEGVAVAVA